MGTPVKWIALIYFVNLVKTSALLTSATTSRSQRPTKAPMWDIPIRRLNGEPPERNYDELSRRSYASNSGPGGPAVRGEDR